MKKMSKSLFAIVLVIAMVLSLIPATFAVEGEATTEKSNIYIEYDIKEHYIPNSNTTYKFADIFNHKTTNGFFSYVADSRNDGNKNYYLRYNAYENLEIYNGQWIILKINVPVAGIYDVKMKNRASTKGQLLNAYIFPMSVTPDASALTDQYFIGAINCDSNSGGVNALENPTSFMKDGVAASYNFLTAGEYYVAFKSVDEAEPNDTTTASYAGNLILDGGSGYALIGDMTVSPESVKAGENATATATAYKSNDGSTVTTLTYTSSNTDVAAVDSTTGVITAKKAGKTIISATAEGSANSISKEFVVKSANLSDITVTYDLMKYADNNITKHADLYNYNTTNDFFKYVCDYTVDAKFNWERKFINGTLQLAEKRYEVFEINVPVAGDYDVKVNYGTDDNGCDMDVYLFKSNGENEITGIELAQKTAFGTVDCNNANDTNIKINPVAQDTPKNLGVYEFEEGKYFFAVKAIDNTEDDAYKYAFLSGLILDGGNGNAIMGGAIGGVSDTLEIGDSAIVSATGYLSATGAEISDFTYSVEGDAVELSGNTLTAKAEGTATITATSADALSGCNTITKTVTVKPAEPGESVSDTLVNFTFVSSDAAAGSVSAKGYPTVGEVEIGTSVEATATANDGYEFAYWRNGAGTVLSTKETATFKFNTNTAVYAEFIKLPDENAAEVPVYFYNGNGNLLESKNVTKGTLFGTAKIANPSLTGYNFEGWSVEDNATINALTRAVALYGDSGEKYTVKADGATITSDATYGSEVTVTSNAADFKAWKLGDKIVSYDKAFTFYVWDDVTLTSITEGEEAPVAVLDEVDGNPMLIYSVPENCEIIEAGILFGEGAEIGSYESKAFAKESTGQFTAEPNGEEENKTARGYLIFKKDGVIRVIYAD